MLLILIEFLQDSQGVQLLCEYDFQNFGLNTLYTCSVRTLSNKDSKILITELIGDHLPTKSAQDVLQLRIYAETPFLPDNLKIFTFLSGLFVAGSLQEIRLKDFQGLDHLLHLNIGYNNLSSIPIDAFTTLNKVKVIDLSANHLKEIQSETFKNNLDLEQIWLTANKIQFVGELIFNHLVKLSIVDLSANLCVSKRYQGDALISELKKGLMSCMKPIGSSNYELTEESKKPIKTLDEKQLELKIEELEEDLRKAKQEIKKILELHGTNFYS